jgi:hypothetical protein
VRVLAFVTLVLATPAIAEPRQVIGYAGVLGEWELTAIVDEVFSISGGEFSGPLKMVHVGICAQDRPEEKDGEIRLRISSSRLTATLSLGGVACTYEARLSDAYKGQVTCPGRPALPLTLWVR